MITPMDEAQRQSLDAFFAQAEDVLTDWHGSPDAMNTGGARAAASVPFPWVGWDPEVEAILDTRRARRWIEQERIAAAILQPPNNRAYVIITGI